MCTSSKIATTCALVIVTLLGFRIYNSISFDRNLGGYLKRAADANTVELAKQNLTIAVDQAREWGMTKGYTSVWYKTPNEDVGFWYENLSASLKELGEVRPDTSLLEKSNVLLKLRQSLLDHSKGTEEVTVPPGIVMFPVNFLNAWILILATIVGGISGLFASTGSAASSATKPTSSS